MDDGFNISGLERKIGQVESSANQIVQRIDSANRKIDAVSEDIQKVEEDLAELRDAFNKFVENTAKESALHRAATELVRVRQEIEQKFGGYRVVRETMLGVLQATDLALVRKNTISQVTEELMLATPDYWLAPCLVAVSAWIGNDRDLANRAIKEAVKRDEEKTALTMALICRRNNRTATCYEWLSLYFSRQSAVHFTESNFTYLSAYLNGVFGPDENHMCDDYVAKWMKEIQANGDDVEQKQIEQWKEYCSGFTVDLEGQFPQLNSYVKEYNDISAYISRIRSVDTITSNFSRMKNAEVDQQVLKRNVDETLVDLISDYDKAEEPLRHEERFLRYIRKFDGDKGAAKAAILAEDRLRTEDTIDLVSQMTNIIVKKDRTSPSKRKTSVSFLSSYIRNGFENYITEKKAAFPKQITLQIDGWSAKTTGEDSVTSLQNSYEKAMEEQREKTLRSENINKPQYFKLAAILLVAVAALGAFVSPILTVISCVGAILCFVFSKRTVSKVASRTNEINQMYISKIASGKQKIAQTMEEWRAAQNIVQTFESEGLPDVVA